MAKQGRDQHENPEGLTEEALLALVTRETGVAEADARSMIEGVKRGEDKAEYFGLTPEIQASLENCGVAYYHGKRYEEALQVFKALVFLTDGGRSSSWRGAAACHQVLHAYQDAVACYLRAIALDESDTLSIAHCGECLCLLGMREEGLALLGTLFSEGKPEDKKSPHMLRAKALLAAGGGPGTPSPEARKHAAHRAASAAAQGPQAAGVAHEVAGTQGEDPGESAAEASGRDENSAAAGASAAEDSALDGNDDDDDDFDFDSIETPELEAADPEIRAMMADHETRQRLEQIAEAVQNKELSIRTLADLSDEQMDAGYAVGCEYLERGELLQAMQVAQQMIWLDGRDTRFYQLAGLCAHGVKLFCLADYYFELVRIWRPGGADAATLIYQGEAKMLSDETERGLSLVQEGIALGRTDPKMAELIRRGEALLKQGEMMRKKAPDKIAGASA